MVKEEELKSVEVQVAVEVGTQNCYELEIFEMLPHLETDLKTVIRIGNLTRTRFKCADTLNN